MGQRAIKGVLSRNSWDFYEYSTAYAFTAMTWFQGGSMAALINNGTQQGNMDVYRAEWYSEQPLAIYWFACIMPTPYPTNSGSPNIIAPCETNQPQPLGYVGSWNAPWFTVANIIRYRVDKPTTDNIEVQSGGPFVTLAPGWGLAVLGLGQPTPPPQVSVTFWYQVLLDNVSQVR